ncbi:MAG: hypothetical protein WDN04_18130 [Rhodospirillales bacterium]
MAAGTDAFNCKGENWIVAACGDGGAVAVTSDLVATSGRNAYGILAQSIGGGGGWLVGGRLSGNGFFANTAAMSGDGGEINVSVLEAVRTTGDGAIGVLAQSIGGGGLLAGDTAAAGATASFQSNSDPENNAGNGGMVNVTVASGAAITTGGANAYGIFAQSVGGGGGLVTSDAGTVIGTAGGVGTSGPINIEVDGSVVTTGAGANAVYIDAEGGTASTNPVSLIVKGTVESGSATNAAHSILIDSTASSNTITNYGTIEAVNLSVPAILATSGPVSLVNQSISGAPGTIIGDVQLRGTVLSGGTFTNAGLWEPYALSSASSFTNSGTIWVGHQGLAPHQDFFMAGEPDQYGNDRDVGRLRPGGRPICCWSGAPPRCRPTA